MEDKTYEKKDAKLRYTIQCKIVLQFFIPTKWMFCLSFYLSNTQASKHNTAQLLAQGFKINTPWGEGS